ILRKQSDWVNLAWSEILLGVNLLNQYQLMPCQTHLQQVDQLLKTQSFSATDQKDLKATLLNLLGVLYELQGDYDRAIRNTQEALAIDLQQTERTAIDSAYISNHYTNLGSFYLIKGDYQRALDHFMQALHSDQDAPSHPILLNNIGELFYALRDYPSATDYFQKSLNLTQKDNQQLEEQMNALIGLGISARKQDKYKLALSYCQRAIALSTTYRQFMPLAVLGRLHLQQQTPVQAIEALNKAFVAYARDSTASISSPLYLSRLYRLLGDAHLANQQAERALHFYQQSLIVNHATFRDSIQLATNPTLNGVYDPIYFLEAIRAKAKAQSQLRQQDNWWDAPLQTYQLALQWMDTLQATYVTETSQLDWSNVFKQIHEATLILAHQAYQATQQEEYLSLAFRVMEKSKNTILLATLNANEGKMQTNIPQAHLKREKDLRLDLAFYEKALRQATENKDSAKMRLYRKYYTESRLELANWKEQLKTDYPKFSSWKSAMEQDALHRLQEKFDDKSILLEYFIGDSTTFVFMLGTQTKNLYKLSAPDQLQANAQALQRALLDVNTFTQNASHAFTHYQQTAQTLYRQLLEPLLNEIPKAVRRLVIVPDGFLYAIPFEALVKTSAVDAQMDFAQLPYLLYDFRIQYAYSANLLLKNEQRQSQLVANPRCLAFAPTYQESNQEVAQNRTAFPLRGSLDDLNNNVQLLEGTAREIQQIAQFFDGQFDLGESASEQNFKQLAPDFGLLHLAMHGGIDLDNANFNYLQFSNWSQDSLEDNLLYHYEITNLDLSAHLAVLSACETGLGKYEEGEGVFSLARSFMYAGVPSVVMSLWKVSDASTSQLMPLFYEQLAQGKNKDEALHTAKLRFLKTADLEFRHPFFWSAFVLMGDASPVIAPAHNWWAVGIGSLLILILWGFWSWRQRI
ncbi:MAG: CHAT domain-containing tetratricopeptide repeat protein, partial [Bacteroidota bacterium]